MPYIFSDPFERESLWYPLVKYIRAALLDFYMRGGTACITAKTAGEAAFTAIERGQAGTCYPIDQETLTWSQMLNRIAHADGRTVRVVTLPSWAIKLGMFGVFRVHKLQGKENGFDLRDFTAMQIAETFLDPEQSLKALGYEMDDLEEAFNASVASGEL